MFDNLVLINEVRCYAMYRITMHGTSSDRCPVPTVFVSNIVAHAMPNQTELSVQILNDPNTTVLA